MTDPASVPAVGIFNEADTVTLSGGDWSATLPVSNLQTRDMGGAGIARTKSYTHASTCLKASIFSGPKRFMGVINDNFVGAAPGGVPPVIEDLRWRVRTIASSSYASPAGFFPRSKPEAILGSPTNLTGTVANLQGNDPERSDGTFMAATSPSGNTAVRVSMQGASCALDAVKPQFVYWRVRRTPSGATAPTARIEVYDAGVLKLAGPDINITSTTGQVLSIAWYATILPGTPPDPNTVQFKLVGTASATATVEPGEMQWACEYASNIVATVRDSGWLTRDVPEDYWGPPRQLSQLYLIHDWGANYDVNQVFMEWQVGANTDGYFQAGRLVITEGKIFNDANGNAAEAEIGWSLLPVDPSEKERTRNSGLRTATRKPYEELSFNLPYVDRATAFETIRRSIDSGGLHRDMLWMIEPGLYIWGTQKDMGPIVEQPTNPPSWSRAFNVEETV